MASGLPDYLKGSRPKYGGADLAASSVIANANGSKELVAIAGKGMLYGGLIRLDYTSTQKDGIVDLFVDEAPLNILTIAQLAKYGISQPGNYPAFITRYDEDNFIYCVGFSYGITFEETLVLNYIEGNGGTPNVVTGLIYALL